MYSTTGWLEKYINNREAYKTTHSSDSIKPEEIAEFDEQKFYEIIQPSGLIYGCPINIPTLENKDIDKLSSKEILKLSLSESLFLCNKQFSDKDINEKDLKDIVDFYQYLFPEITGSYISKLFKITKNNSEKAESFIEKQVNLRTSIDNFWASFFLNSLLFLDVIYFSVWLKSKNKQSNHYIKKEKEEIYMLLLQILAIAIHSDNKVEESEVQFYNLFIKSAKLSKENLIKAKNFLEYPPKLAHVKLKTISSWLLKKYILEIAILSIWTDKEIHDLELKFLRELTQLLDLTQEELDKSMLSVEFFVLNNWDKITYLQGKKNYELVSQKFIESFKRSININKAKLSKEISESKELVALLKKSSEEELNEEEKLLMKNQLIDILKTIPMFVIFLLPGSFFTLPILFKVIPKTVLFPSSFHE